MATYGLVPLYQKYQVDKELVEKEVGELLLYPDHVEVTYDYRDGDTLAPKTVQDAGNTEFLSEFITTSKLWMSKEGVVWINCKDYLVSVVFEKGRRPIYMIAHQNELQDALDVLMEPQFS